MTPGARSPNWFAAGGAEYARARPDYPPEVAASLAAALSGDARERAGDALTVDVGCGGGQFTEQLAAVLPRVIGLDPSVSQVVSRAPARGGAADVGGAVEPGGARVADGPRPAGAVYACAAAEHLPLADASASLVTAAQAAHWFDLPAFFAEARRVLEPGGLLALLTYATPVVGPPGDPAADLFDRFYRGDDGVGPYWPPERALIDDGYARIVLPDGFAELPVRHAQIRREWTCAELLAYVSTWSATRAARATGEGGRFERFADALAAVWGDGIAPHGHRRTVRWRVTMRQARAR